MLSDFRSVLQGDTPLHAACRKGHEEVIDLLLQSFPVFAPVSDSGSVPVPSPITAPAISSEFRSSAHRHVNVTLPVQSNPLSVAVAGGSAGGRGGGINYSLSNQAAFNQLLVPESPRTIP